MEVIIVNKEEAVLIERKDLQDIDSIVVFLQECKKKGQNVCVDFYGYKLYSCNVTLNSAYMEIFGMTKLEYEARTKYIQDGSVCRVILGKEFFKEVAKIKRVKAVRDIGSRTSKSKSRIKRGTDSLEEIVERTESIREKYKVNQDQLASRKRITSEITKIQEIKKAKKMYRDEIEGK